MRSYFVSRPSPGQPEEEVANPDILIATDFESWGRGRIQERIGMLTDRAVSVDPPTVDALARGSIGKRFSINLKLTCLDSASYGLIRGIVEVVTNSIDRPHFSIPFRARIVGVVASEPSIMFFNPRINPLGELRDIRIRSLTGTALYAREELAREGDLFFEDLRIGDEVVGPVARSQISHSEVGLTLKMGAPMGDGGKFDIEVRLGLKGGESPSAIRIPVTIGSL